MRLIADLIRGERVSNALNILKYDAKHPSAKMEKLLLSAINNWEAKNTDVKLEEAARTLGLRILPLKIGSERDFEMAFATLVDQGASALLVVGGAFFTPHRVQLAILATRHTIPAIYPLREFTMAGGLLSYAANLADAYRQVGIYVGRILK